MFLFNMLLLPIVATAVFRLIDDAIRYVLEKYKSLGGTDQIAKGSALIKEIQKGLPLQFNFGDESCVLTS